MLVRNFYISIEVEVGGNGTEEGGEIVPFLLVPPPLLPPFKHFSR